MRAPGASLANAFARRTVGPRTGVLALESAVDSRTAGRLSCYGAWTAVYAGSCCWGDIA